MAKSESAAKVKRRVVARVDEFGPGERRVVTVDGREIGVFNLDGVYYALLNYCPHRGGPLCHGRVRPLVTAESVTQVEYGREGEILKCPWHQWEFDIKTGRALFDERLRVKSYRVEAEAGDVVVYW
ncbi:MAG: Rieske (2Fe-2S) protein [Caldilineaceae bacterium]